MGRTETQRCTCTASLLICKTVSARCARMHHRARMIGSCAPLLPAITAVTRSCRATSTPAI
eukprot:9322605-Alexandrium_andersonii.AAC.1